MPETHLLKKYSKAEEDELMQWLLSRTSGKPQSAPPPEPQPAAQPPASDEPGGGFFKSIYKAGVAIPKRIGEGYGQLKEAISPTGGTLSDQITGKTKEPSPLEGYLGKTGARVVEGAMGTLNMVFPLPVLKGKPGKPKR